MSLLHKHGRVHFLMRIVVAALALTNIAMHMPAHRMKYRTACVLLFLFIDRSTGRGGSASASSASSKGSPTGGGRGASSSSAGRGVDRFVRAAPFIVGVKCSDGVLLLAAHTFDDDEPLLYFYPSGSDDDGVNRDVGSSKSSSDDLTTTTTAASSARSSPARGSSFQNLPSHYAGPFRIQVIDPSSCLAMASTGWRADCDDLVRTARAMAAHELSRYGPPSGGAAANGSDGDADADRRGTVLSCDLSLYLARCAVSEEVRPSEIQGVTFCLVATLSADPSFTFSMTVIGRREPRAARDYWLLRRAYGWSTPRAPRRSVPCASGAAPLQKQRLLMFCLAVAAAAAAAMASRGPFPTQ
jgi:hypothetical protein